MAEYVAADTTVISYLSAASKESRAYQALLGNGRLAVSFQTLPELAATGFSPDRQKRVDDLLAATMKLPHSEATNTWYARVTERRRELRKMRQPGSDASDADAWIISSALEFGLPLLSHDKQQVALGRALGLRVLTNLEGLRDDNPVI